MSRQTPKPPPKPVAALLSPVLWAMEGPDKFDMYSAGITLLQLAFPALRGDNGLIAFNRKLRDLNYDLDAWRDSEAMSVRGGQWPRDLAEGFEVLDADGGAGWDLAKRLVAYKPGARLTAAAALRHPFLATAPAGAPAGAPGAPAALLSAAAAADSLSSTVGAAITRTAETVGSAGGTLSRSIEGVLPAGLVEEALTASSKGALTEAFLLQEFGDGTGEAGSGGGGANGAGGGGGGAPAPPREARQTIAWWQGKQQEMQRRKRAGGGNGNGNGGNGSGASSPDGTRSLRRAAAAAAANGNGNGKARIIAPSPPPSMSTDEDDGAPPSPGGTGAAAASKVKELLSVFGRRS